VNELLLLRARAKSEGGQIAVFFIDGQFRHQHQTDEIAAARHILIQHGK
jgi:hypothetical protein